MDQMDKVTVPFPNRRRQIPAIQPFMFVLQEGPQYSEDFLDYDLKMLDLRVERIHAPKHPIKAAARAESDAHTDKTVAHRTAVLLREMQEIGRRLRALESEDCADFSMNG